MSERRPGFRGRSIEDVQQRVFLDDLPLRSGGRWRYQTSGLNAAAGTLVLFQYRARIVANAIFLRDETFARPRRGSVGVLHFDPESFRTFAPLDLAAMRQVWPSFRAFGHVKQHLNPTLYARFKRRLKSVKSPPVPRPGSDLESLSGGQRCAPSPSSASPTSKRRAAGISSSSACAAPTAGPNTSG